jgi:hypothetical protein
MSQYLVAQALDVQAKTYPQGVNALNDDPHRDQRGRQDPKHEEAAGQQELNNHEHRIPP